MRYFWRLYESIESLIIWFPVIWKDRQFDQHFLLKMLTFKLRRMEKHFRSDDCWAMEGVKYADQMREVRFLLERLNDESYYMTKAWKCYEDNYGSILKSFIDNGGCLKRYHLEWWVEEEVEDDLGRKTLLRVKHTSEEDEHTLIKEASWKEHFLMEKDFLKAFELMAMHIRGWWD